MSISVPFIQSDVELDDKENVKDSNDSVTSEVVKKNVECIYLELIENVSNVTNVEKEEDAEIEELNKKLKNILSISTSQNTPKIPTLIPQMSSKPVVTSAPTSSEKKSSEQNFPSIFQQKGDKKHLKIPLRKTCNPISSKIGGNLGGNSPYQNCLKQVTLPSIQTKTTVRSAANSVKVVKGDAGGSSGKMEAAREEEYFRKLQSQHLDKLKKHVTYEISQYKGLIQHHSDAIDTLRSHIQELESMDVMKHKDSTKE